MKHTSLAERLRVLRARKDWHVREAAEKLGLTRHTLRELETGRRQPSYTTLQKLAAGYGVNIEEIVAGEEGSELPKGATLILLGKEGQRGVAWVLSSLVNYYREWTEELRELAHSPQLTPEGAEEKALRAEGEFRVGENLSREPLLKEMPELDELREVLVALLAAAVEVVEAAGLEDRADELRLLAQAA